VVERCRIFWIPKIRGIATKNRRKWFKLRCDIAIKALRQKRLQVEIFTLQECSAALIGSDFATFLYSL
jgi:hypothetical protein